MYKNTVWECSAAEDVCLPPAPETKFSLYLTHRQQFSLHHASQEPEVFPRAETPPQLSYCVVCLLTELAGLIILSSIITHWCTHLMGLCAPFSLLVFILAGGLAYCCNESTF